MKKLALHNTKYCLYLEGYTQWLHLCGYSPTAVYNFPLYIREFFHWLEGKNIRQITRLTTKHSSRYIHYISHRKNQRREGGLSVSAINAQILSIKLLYRYLYTVHQIQLPLALTALKETDKTISILTHQEIQELIAQTDHSPGGLRDRAIIALYYGCGLRRSEGTALDLQDMQISKALLHIRKAKNRKARMVPIGSTALDYLTEYMDQARPKLLKNTTEQAFLLNHRGRRLAGQSVRIRIKKLQQKSTCPILRQKNIAVHSLRHSIATHLLQQKMPLELISHFLGHQSLEATQRYTHISHEL